VPPARDLPRDIGAFIRDLRHKSRISLRQLAEQAGVSNPYLSQIERGLRKPSAEVLAQLASALRISTPLMYLRAGLLEARDGPDVLAAIAADADLTVAQKQSLTQIYETFRRENARAAGVEPSDIAVEPTEPATSAVDNRSAGEPANEPVNESAGVDDAPVRRTRNRRSATTEKETS
jgi:transcriptional regulator with XRE-family HTH domain